MASSPVALYILPSVSRSLLGCVLILALCLFFTLVFALANVMSALASGTYTIEKSIEQQFLTVGMPTAGADIELIKSVGGAPEMGSQWEVQAQDNGLAYIKNVQTGLYVSYPGCPHEGKHVCTSHGPCEWKLEPTSRPSQFYLVVPETDGGDELCLDRFTNPSNFSQIKLNIKQGTAFQVWNFNLVQ